MVPLKEQGSWTTVHQLTRRKQCKLAKASRWATKSCSFKWPKSERQSALTSRREKSA